MQLIFLLFLLLFTACVGSARADAAPAWHLKNLAGQEVALSDFSGKVVVLDFWATWCAPCRAEIPVLIGLQNEYGSSHLQVIGISEDSIPPSAVQKFVEAHQINYPIVLATPPVVASYQAQGLPTLVVIDPHGNIVARHVGLTTKEALEAAIKPLLPATTAYAMPSPAEVKAKLTPEQYAVTQEAETEPAFTNAYWNNKAPGIYVDVVTGRPLFSTTDQFDSGCGWPSFSKPIQEDLIVKKEDASFGMSRTEVRATQSNSHLGHVFDDGPGPTGLRYCINSASLRFVPKENMAEQGYGTYLNLFNPTH